VGRDVGDVDPEADPVAVRFGRDGVVEVAGGGGVDGERPQLAEVAPGRVYLRRHRYGRARLLLYAPCETAALQPLPEQCVDDVSGALGRTQQTRYPEAAWAGLSQDHLPRLGLELAAHQRELAATLEQRLEHVEAAATRDHAGNSGALLASAATTPSV
jgi:hypothetical protein